MNNSKNKNKKKNKKKNENKNKKKNQENVINKARTIGYGILPIMLGNSLFKSILMNCGSYQEVVFDRDMNNYYDVLRKDLDLDSDSYKNETIFFDKEKIFNKSNLLKSNFLTASDNFSNIKSDCVLCNKSLRQDYVVNKDYKDYNIRFFYNINDVIFKSACCNNFYHYDCIVKWTYRNNKCPACVYNFKIINNYN